VQKQGRVWYQASMINIGSLIQSSIHKLRGALEDQRICSSNVCLLTLDVADHA
jgi:hypothetical protein